MAKRSKQEPRIVLVQVGRGKPITWPVTSNAHRRKTTNPPPYGRAINFTSVIPFVRDVSSGTNRVYKQCRGTPWPYQAGKPLTERQRRKGQRIAAAVKRMKKPWKA